MRFEKILVKGAGAFVKSNSIQCAYDITCSSEL